LALAEVAAAISPLDLMEQRVRIQYLAPLLAQAAVKEFLVTTHRPEGLAVVEALAVVELEPHPEALEILPVLVHHKATMAVLVRQALKHQITALAAAAGLPLLVRTELLLPVVMVAQAQHLLFLDFLLPTLAVVVVALTKAVLLEQAAQVVVALEPQVIRLVRQELLIPVAVGVGAAQLSRLLMGPGVLAAPASSFFAIQSLFRP
jgi:hypothetical protein